MTVSRFPVFLAGPRDTAPPAPSGGTREHGTERVVVDDWRDLGACRGQPAKIWYANEPSGSGTGSGSYVEGKRICAACPVRVECLQWALDTAEPFGLWGGVSPRGRSKILRERGLVPLRSRSFASLQGKR